MKKLLTISLATLALGLFLMPQSASAAPSLDWQGKDQITYQVPQSVFGFDVIGQSMNHGKKAARNAGRALSGGVQLAIGIPVTILGVALLVPAIYLFVQGDILFANGEEGAALLSRIGGVLMLSLALPALITGIKLVVGGATELSKIQASRAQNRIERYAMKNQRRARWGMQVSLAGVPLTR
jgi:hypothetical protein